MNVYVCGNPFVKEDFLPLCILSLLRKNYPSINFVEFDPTEDLPHEPELTIIDTIINVNDVVFLQDIDAFVQNKAVSLHDFDLGMNLKLAKKMGWLKKVHIIGVPPKIEQIQAVQKIGNIIDNFDKLDR